MRIQNKHRSLRYVLALSSCLVGLMLFSTTTLSRSAGEYGNMNVTPSEVFQVVDDIYAELLLIQKANASDEIEVEYRTLTQRTPRHVFQKAREVFIKVQQLRYINGLALNEAPAIPTQKVIPYDDKVMLEHVLEDIRELRRAYGVIEEAVPATLKPNKTPTDVYANITKVSDLVSGLDIPSIVPNDVYRLITTINSVITDILKTRKVKVPKLTITPSVNKKPKDVYQETLNVMALVNDLCKKDKAFCIESGAIAPNEKKGRITPGNVLELMNNLLADVVEIKVNLGDSSPNPLAPDLSGKTPSNVYDEVMKAKLLIKAL